MRQNALIILAFMGTLLLPAWSVATPEYAAKEGVTCSVCHNDPNGGGQLTGMGEFYKLHQHLPSKAESSTRIAKPLLPLGRSLRFLIGYLHVLIGVIWFGAIFYVHIIIGPRKLSAGLPKEERILGLSALIGVGLTGALLTLSKIGGFHDFTNSLFGIVLAVKICLYLIMVTLAVITITVLHRKLVQAGASVRMVAGSEIGPDLLADYNGQGDRPSCVAVDGLVYDVSESKLWKGGLHMRRHRAGADLTDAIEESPHGRAVLQKFAVSGRLKKDEGKISHRGEPLEFRIFHTFAYINLFMALFILLCVSIWRWGIPFFGH